MPHLPNSTIFVVGNRIMTSGDFVFEAEQGSLDAVIDDFGPPIINFISPSVIMEGERITITMSSHRTYNPLRLAVQGSGVTASNPQVVSETQVTVDIAVDANALDERDNADFGDARDIRVITLEGQSDDNGTSLEQQTIAENLITIYFGPPSISSVGFFAPDGIINQGDTINLSVSGNKMYHKKWGGSTTEMTAALGAPGEATFSVSPVIDGKASASISNVAISQTATRGQKDVSVTTYSGTATLSQAVEVFFREPSITAMYADDGAGGWANAQGEVLQAGTTKSFKILADRLEGVTESATNIKLGAIDNNGVFSQLVSAADGTQYNLAGGQSNLPSISFDTNLANQPGLQSSYTGSLGLADEVEFDIVVPADMPADLSGLSVQVTTLIAAGSQTAHSANVATISIDGAAPTISSLSVAGRTGDETSTLMDNASRTVSVTGVFYGALDAVKLMKSGVDQTGANGVTIANAVKVSNTQVDFDLTIHPTTDPTLERAMTHVEITTDTGTSLHTNAARIEVLPDAPALDAITNGITLFRPDSGTSIQSFTLTGDNLYNSLLAGGSLNKATNAGFPGYFGATEKMTASLSNTSGVNSLTVRATADGGLSAEIELASSALVNTQRDLTIQTRSGSVTLANAVDVVPEDPTMATTSVSEMMEGSSATAIQLGGTNFFPTGPAQLDNEEIYVVDPHDATISDLGENVDAADMSTWSEKIGSAYQRNNIAFRKVDLLNGTDGRQLQFAAPAGFEIGVADKSLISDKFGDFYDNWDPEAADDGGFLTTQLRIELQNGVGITWAATALAVEGDILAIRPAQAGLIDDVMTVTDVSGLANPPAPKSISLKAYVPTNEETVLKTLDYYESVDDSRRAAFQAYADGNSTHGATMTQEQFDDMAFMILSATYDPVTQTSTDIRGGTPTDPNNGLTQALVEQAAAWFMSFEAGLATLKDAVVAGEGANLNPTQDAEANQYIADMQAHYAAVQALIDATANDPAPAGFQN